MMKTALVSNDDGLTDGLRISLEIAKSLGYSAYALTPSQQRSAVAKGVTLHRALRLRRVEEEAQEIYTLNGTPADCAAFAINSGEFAKPEMIFSGVNVGDNLSLHSVYSSGTIGACMEGAFYSVPGIALSYELHRQERQRHNYCVWEKRDAIKARAVEICKKLIPNISPGIIYNVNFPTELDGAEVRVVRPAPLRYFSMLEKRVDPNGIPYYWQYGEDRKAADKGSDVYELYVNKCITITPLKVWGIVDDGLIGEISKLF
jgi:5'-nucleotidase